MKTLLIAAVGAAGAVLMAADAHAGTWVNADIDIGAPGVYVQPAPVYTQPRPVYVQPRPVYVQPRPVYTQPWPYYVQPQPVYVGRGRHHHHHHHGRGARPYGDRDGDGWPNYADGDRDGDGVPNRFDRRPNNYWRD